MPKWLRTSLKHYYWWLPCGLYSVDAQAWGLVTHIYFAHSLLWAMPLLDPRLQKAIRRFPELVMAGACLPDLAVVSKRFQQTHQWENAQNYLYYDALYGGYPLVHNSEFLQREGMGFFYPGFEASLGGNALLEAWRKEPAFWEGYRSAAATYLAKVPPGRPANVQAFAERIESLVGETQ